MPADKALLWRVIDAAERAVAPRLEDAVRTGAFAEALGLATRVQAATRRQMEDRSRRLWHLVNLPAGSDVARLRRQVASLDRELHRFTTAHAQALAEHRPPEEADDADDSHDSGARRAARPRRAAGSRAPGRRAQRAPRP